jgi:hypothetical protein
VGENEKRLRETDANRFLKLFNPTIVLLPLPAANPMFKNLLMICRSLVYPRRLKKKYGLNFSFR